jgi:transcriptional regulator with XRE-family HTH domain
LYYIEGVDNEAPSSIEDNQFDREICLSFGMMLRQARLLVGISQKELGARIGIGRGYISQLENGLKNPTLVRCARLFRALGVVYEPNYRRKG